MTTVRELGVAILACAFLAAARPARAGETPVSPDEAVLKWEGRYWRYHLVLRPPMVVESVSLVKVTVWPSALAGN